MNLLFLPELFYQTTTNLNDKEKIFLASCSRITYRLKSLLILDSEYNLGEINDELCVKNILIKDFSLENKIEELIKNLIPESIIINLKYVKFISNSTNIKFFANRGVMYGYICYRCPYAAAKLLHKIINLSKTWKETSGNNLNY